MATATSERTKNIRARLTDDAHTIVKDHQRIISAKRRQDLTFEDALNDILEQFKVKK